MLRLCVPHVANVHPILRPTPQTSRCNNQLRTHLKPQTHGVISLPESVPAINFAAYKARIPVAGMVDNFEKEYEALKVPYPEDTVSQQIAEVEGQAAAEVQAFIKGSEGRIAKLTEELSHWEAMIPYDQMTMEEWAEAFPDQAITMEKPTMWPHLPEDQPGYVAKEGAEQ